MLTMLSRAFGWNLGKIVPSQAESAALAASSITDPTVQKYAVWRKSALSFAAMWTGLAFVLGVFDAVEAGFDESTMLGVGFEVAWLLSALMLMVACVVGAVGWKRPGSGFSMLVGAWLTSFLLYFIWALLPVTLLYNIKFEPTVGEGLVEKEMGELVVTLVMSAGEYLMLFPMVLSLIPGTVNGCLRIKALLPASQLPGWLLVCAGPLFLLFWIIVLVIVNTAANSWFLVLGVLLWAGAPIWYSANRKLFVESQIGETEAARIGGVKRMVALTALIGLGLLLTFALTQKVTGFNVLGFDPETAVSTKLEELADLDDEVSRKDVETAFEDSTSLVYALDLSNWRLIVDFLSKLLVVSVVFADVVLRATVSAWKNERKFRSGAGVEAYDSTMAQAAGVVFPHST